MAVSPITPEAFAALVADLRAELAAASPLRREEILNRTGQPPDCYARHPWVRFPLTLKQAAPVTGLSWYTLRNYAKPGAVQRYGTAALPPAVSLSATRGGVRTAGDFALWAARREKREGAGRRSVKPPPKPPRRSGYVTPAASPLLAQILAGERARAKRTQVLRERAAALQAARTGIPRRPRRPPPTPWQRDRAAILAMLRAATREDPRTDTAAARQLIRDAGLILSPERVAGMVAQARRLEFGWMLSRLEPMEDDGLVTCTEISEALGITPRAVFMGIYHGRLQRAGKRGRDVLLDKSRLRLRADYRREPVDQDHPMAAPLPLRGIRLAVRADHVRDAPAQISEERRMRRRCRQEAAFSLAHRRRPWFPPHQHRLRE